LGRGLSRGHRRASRRRGMLGVVVVVLPELPRVDHNLFLLFPKPNHLKMSTKSVILNDLTVHNSQEKLQSKVNQTHDVQLQSFNKLPTLQLSHDMNMIAKTTILQNSN
jgi:hypothetical protein